MEQEKEAQFEGKYHYGLGRRKTAVANVRLYKGNGKIIVNGKDEKEYFRGFDNLMKKISSPLVTTGHKGKFDISAQVNGGGVVAQADAILLGVSRALMKLNDT